MLATIRACAARCARARGADAARGIAVRGMSSQDASTASTATGGVSDTRGDRDAAFLADRKRWRADVNSLRKQWREDFDVRAAEKARAKEAMDAEIQAQKAARLEVKAKERAARAGQASRTLEEAKRAKERQLRIIAGHRRQREHAMSLRRQAREVDLLKQSRTWIATAEELEVRIERALAHPERLF